MSNKWMMGIALGTILCGVCIIFTEKPPMITEAVGKTGRLLEGVKESLPQVLKSESKSNPISPSEMTTSEIQVEIETIQKDILDPAVIEALNHEEVSEVRRADILNKMYRLNSLHEHLMKEKVKEFSDRTDAVLAVQKEEADRLAEDLKREE